MSFAVHKYIQYMFKNKLIYYFEFKRHLKKGSKKEIMHHNHNK